MAYIVEDELGNRYETLTTAATAHGIAIGGSARKRFLRDNRVVVNGVAFTLVEGDPTKKIGGTPRVGKDPLAERLRKVFTEQEIELLLRGESLARYRLNYPEIHLTGEHHRLLVISDTHIGSIYSPPEWHDVVSDYANTHDIEAILHCGDLVEGMKISRAGTQIYELSEMGYEKQKAKSVELLSKYKPPIYIISGNHDFYYREYAGANIVQEVANSLEGVTYVGHNSVDIEVGGVIIRLFHGGDGGSSYALSYRLQKLVEAAAVGKEPDILLAGHTHKYCCIYERGVHAISVPCMQMQTDFMRGKKLAAHTGFLLLEFDSLGGKVRNLSVQLFPFE